MAVQLKLHSTRAFTLIAAFIVLSLSALLLILNRGDHVFLYSDIVIGEEVSFDSDGIAISGSLLKPDREGEVPAVIMIVGSGAYSYRRSWERGNFPFWKDISSLFVENGFAVLLLEKRGVNASEGNWEKSDFYDRADDVHSAITYLQGRGDIQSSRIGLLGHSQGGWIAQLVAQEFPEDVAFIITLAGPSFGVKQQVLDDMANEWRCQGLDEPEVERKLRLWRKAFDVYGGLSRVLSTGHLSRIINYDPKETIPGIRCPVFAVYGETDYLVVPTPNAALLREGLGKGGNDRFEIHVIPKANHGFQVSGKCFEWEELAHDFAPGFMDVLRRFFEWIG